MTPISLGRRCLIAVVTLLLAGAIFHGQVASALVTRGDDALRNGDTSAAVRYYERAVAFDPASASAADRLAFSLAMRHAPGEARAAVAVATAALARVPNNPALFADRGLAEQRLRRWHAAERDFAQAGVSGRDARYDHLAGRIALRLGDRTGARGYFIAALHHDPNFDPARVALDRLR